MAAAALALYGVSLLVTFGLRVGVQVRRTGSTGLKGLSGSPGSIEWLAGVLFVVSLALGAASPALVLLGALDPIATLDGVVGHALGVVLAVAGIALTFGAQLAMGDAWRVGVDPEERTQLVTDGPFGLVRNPIYSAMTPTIAGLALMVPTVLAIAGLICLVVALELQVRMVEEPHLRRAHGDAYVAYGSRVGRFVPGLGFLSER
jgi:protein-S-isoprenylcysteine O-methyltransferase Ste14